MPRRPRSLLPDGTYHVTTRGAAQCAIFRDDLDRALFLKLVADAVQVHDWRVHAFCLMNTHYHLVLDATRSRLSTGFQRVNGVYAQAFNARHRQRGHLFGARFSSWLVEGDEYLSSTCRYVLLNPVRAGLCERSEDWRWSWSRYGKRVD